MLGYSVVARLKSFVMLSSARDEAKSLVSDLAQRYPATNSGRSLDTIRLREQTLGAAKIGLWLLMGARSVHVDRLRQCRESSACAIARATLRN